LPVDQVAALSNEVVETITDDFVIVLDDAHTLGESTAAEALGLLVKDLPPNAHLAVASRRKLPFPRLGGGSACGLDEDALALSREESALLLRSLGLRRSPTRWRTLSGGPRAGSSG